MKLVETASYRQRRTCAVYVIVELCRNEREEISSIIYTIANDWHRMKREIKEGRQPEPIRIWTCNTQFFSRAFTYLGFQKGKHKRPRYNKHFRRQMSHYRREMAHRN